MEQPNAKSENIGDRRSTNDSEFPSSHTCDECQTVFPTRFCQTQQRNSATEKSPETEHCSRRDPRVQKLRIRLRFNVIWNSKITETARSLNKRGFSGKTVRSSDYTEYVFRVIPFQRNPNYWSWIPWLHICRLKGFVLKSWTANNFLFFCYLVLSGFSHKNCWFYGIGDSTSFFSWITIIILVEKMNCVCCNNILTAVCIIRRGLLLLYLKNERFGFSLLHLLQKY